MKNLQSRTKVRLLQSLLLISLSLFFLVNPAYAQGGFAVKGVIVDKTGFPLPGANVMEKGTSNGTITDLDGNFSLNVSKKGVTLTVWVSTGGTCLMFARSNRSSSVSGI